MQRIAREDEQFMRDVARLDELKRRESRGRDGEGPVSP
jgi:hypothetical protein